MPSDRKAIFSLVVNKGLQDLGQDMLSRAERREKEERARAQWRRSNPDLAEKEDDISRSRNEWKNIHKTNKDEHAKLRDKNKAEHTEKRDKNKADRKDLDERRSSAVEALKHWKEHKALPEGSRFKSKGDVIRTLKQHDENVAALEDQAKAIDKSEDTGAAKIDKAEKDSTAKLEDRQKKYAPKTLEPEAKKPEAKEPEAKKPSLWDRAKNLFKKYKEEHPKTEKTPQDFVKKASEEMLRDRLIRVAHEHPNLRRHIVPVLRRHAHHRS